MSSGEPFVGPGEDDCPCDPRLERRMNLPGEYAALLLLAQPHGIDAEFGQHQRPIDCKIVQSRNVPLERCLIVEIDVEADEVGEVDRQIFGRRKVGIADECFRMRLSDACHQAPDKSTYRLGAVPTNDVGRDFVADKIPKDSAMAPASVDPRGYCLPNLGLNCNTVEKCNVLRPGQSDEDF